MLSKLEDIQQLSSIAQNDIFAVVSGDGLYATGIPNLCSRIVAVIERFLDPIASIDLDNPSVQGFLKETLPALTEAFLRRVTLREHEDDVAKLLIAVARLLAKPASHDIVELCALRNLILVGILPQQLQFINPKQFTSNQYIGNHFSNEGFYGDYGAPSVAYLGSKMLTFWPDEWQKALGGVKAVGHFVEWYHRGLVDHTNEKENTKDAAQEPAAGWLVGRVVSYTRETAEHTIQLEPLSTSASENDTSPIELAKTATADGDAAPTPTFHSVNLSKVKHHWIDAEYRNRIALQPVISPGTVTAGESLLEFAVTDVGQFIRIWWSRYTKFYYGRVVKFDPVSRMHTVSYEDGDTRAYDMQTKDYAVIAPPAEVLQAANESDLTDKEASKIVADWHRALESTLESAAADAKAKAIHDGEAVPFRLSYIHRPVAATALTWSIFQLAVIDEYFREGGADALFQSLTDASQAPPISRIILLHLHMVCQLRGFLGVERFNELAWDLKEAIPFALLRYEDAQIKELSSKTLNDLFNGLREIIQLVVNGSQYTTNHTMRENIDELRLTIASMLLVCSQLQKRYMGLSMIKETLDTLLPRLDNYVTKRYNAIGVARAVRAPPSRPTSVASNASRITLAYMDKWLVDNGVLEILFGESLHQDLVAKSDVLLLYMGSRKVLTEKHIDLIWNASLGVHEAVVRVLHQLLVLIVPVLGVSLRNYLFSLMAALPCKDYTEQILQLIKAYTEQALIASKDDNSSNGAASASPTEANPISGSNGPLSRKGQVLNVPQRQWMGFGVLWQFVQDPSVTPSSGEATTSGKAQTDSVDEGLVDLAVQLLVELLQEEFKDERELVMQRCLDNIQAGRSVPVSLQILRRTLALYPQAPKSWFVLGRPGVSKTITVAHQIEKLIKNSHLLEILFRDLDAYHRSILASEKVDNNSNSSAAAGMKQSRSLLGIDKIVPKIMMRGNASSISAAVNGNAPAPASHGLSSKSAHATGRVSQLKGVSERLDFLRFIISWSSVKLSEQQTMILWNAFGEGATTVETLEKLFLWFNVLINKESKALVTLLNSISQESDPTDPDQRSKLVFLSPQLFALIQQQGYSFPGATNSNALTLLAAGTEDEAMSNSTNTAGPATESHSTFDDGVLIKLFEENIMKWAFRIEKVDNLSRLPVANLCFKLFLHTNINNKSLKVESDGSWSRVGPLSGLPLLWRIALDSTDLIVAHAAIALLIELHHKCSVVQKPVKAGDLGYKANLLQLCFKHLYLALNSLQLEDGVSPSTTSSQAATEVTLPSQRKPAASASGAPNSPILSGSLGESSTAADEWFHDQDSLMKPSVIAARIERLIITLRLAIHRHYMAPSVLHTIKVLVGREEAPVFTVVLKATDRVGQLRRKIAEHFKESVETIQILKTAKVSSLMGMSAPTQETLDRDDLTLVQAKLAVQDSVTARKNDSSGGEIGQPPGSMQSPKPRANDVKDLFSPQDLTVNLLKPLNPLEWIGACSSGVGESAPKPSGAKCESALSSAYELFVLPPFPLVSVIESKLNCQEIANPTALPEEPTVVVSTKGPVVATRESPTAFISAPTAASERCTKVLEQLTPLFRAAPHHIDQLLEILDGYLSTEGVESRGSSGTDLSAAVWDILLSLPVHVQMSQQLKGMLTETNASVLSRLLSPSCPYRLLYSLRIIDTFLSLGSASNAFPKGTSGSASNQATAASAAVLDWTVKLFHIGGAEYILQLLDTFLAKECQREVKSPKVGKMSARATQEGMPRKDLNVMIISILSRVLYHLLMLDPHFRGWQSSSANEIQSRLYATFEDPTVGHIAEIVPAGVILSNVDVKGLCTHIMKCSLQATELYKVQLITSAALRALCENSFLLMFGLLSSVGDGYEILSSSELFRPWLSALCVRCSSKAVRQAACRRLFEVSANVFNKCADPTVSQEDKRGRLRFYDFIHEEIVVAVSPESVATTSKAPHYSQGKIKHGEEVYTLVAVIEALRNSSYLIFPQLSSKRVMRSSSGKIPDGSSPRSLVTSPAETLRSSMPAEVNSLDEDPAGTAALIRLFITKLMNHNSNESFHSAEPDGTLVGTLRVLLIFANSSDPQRVAMGEMTVDLDDGTTAHLIPYIYSNCLFPTLAPGGASVGDVSPTANSNVEFLGTVEAGCQTQESRQLAYALLYRLCESTPTNLSQLVEAIGGEILSTAVAAPQSAVLTEMSEFDPSAAMKRIPTWNYDPDTLLKEPDAYVGLCNQGGTCYMNSFIQQLFHIPAFKAGLLRINASKGKGDTADEALDANAQLLFQLQVMFGFMNFSQKRYYDTLPFCRAFIDYDGEPISLSEQKDINEFAGMLFDKLEANKEAAALLASTIQGKIVWRTRSIETPYRSEREENFYMLTAEVKDKATLEDSLELFTADELFSGDNKIEDADTGKKVDALRGCAIRSLPSTLIIHLKRFEFDLETMNRKKVNDLIAFPTDLNMFPYTEEGLQAKEDKLRASGSSPVPAAESSGEDNGDSLDEEARPSGASTSSNAPRRPDGYYQYALKGVVAHVGAIDRGHYYSFIKNPEEGAGSSGVWQEFNDRSVLPFSPEAIPLECFGGKDEYVNSNGVTVSRARENSAYLLVYERVGDSGEEPFEANRQRLRSESMDETAVGGVRGMRSSSIDETQPRRGVSKKVMRAVSTENAEFQRDRFLFHSLHFAFIWQLQHMQSVVDLLQTVKGRLSSTDEQDLNKKYIYDSTDPEDITLTLTVPNQLEDRSGANSAGSAVSHLVLDSMRFIVEVLVRARAKSCVQLFLERLEEIVLQDVSGAAARFLIEFLIGDDTASPASPSPDSSTASGAAPDFAEVSTPAASAAKPRVQLDLEHIDRVCHPWLAQMLIFCPHASTTRLFLRFLLACVKVIRVAQQSPSFSAAEVPLSTTEVTTGEKGATVVLNIPSCVAALVDKVLIITEKPQLDYLGCRENFELRALFILQFAGLGSEEKALLVHLGAIPRVSCAVMAQYPSAIKSNDVRLYYCIDIIAKLVRASRSKHIAGVTGGASNTADSTSGASTESVSKVDVPIYLKPIDLQAFLGRTFLEEAVLLHPAAASAAAAHIYRLITAEDAASMLDFLAERLCDQLGVNTSGALPAYRSFLRVLSDLLLGVALPDILLHVGALMKVITKAQALANRQVGLDCEFVFAALRLLHTLGSASPEAHSTVLQLRDLWRNIAPKLAAAKRTATYSAEGVLQNPPGQQQTSTKNGGNGNKTTSSATSFMMN